LTLAVRLCALRPQVVRLDAGDWGAEAHGLDPPDARGASGGPLQSQAPAEA
jgi:hypothetical protein